MDRFVRELEIGEIHQRDRLQFELKSEFFPLPNLEKNIYTQEFYLFVPNSLRINEDTYSQQEFYRDQTTFIRYKTPKFTLHMLSDLSHSKSPFARLDKLLKLPHGKELLETVSYELKLLGNILRSAIRERVSALIRTLPKQEEIFDNLQTLCSELSTVRDLYFSLQTRFITSWKTEEIKAQFFYVDEFISNTIHYYLTGLLDQLMHRNVQNLDKINLLLCDLLSREQLHRRMFLHAPSNITEDSFSNEFILYRSNLLDKFVLDALLLNTTRSSIHKRFRNVIGSLSAGIAMLFFFVLFIWQGEVFLINSLPFILITVILYILKDRMKESLKTLSYQQFSKWFYDYNTNIQSPDDRIQLGKLSESVSFVNENKIPEEIKRIRSREFHTVLESYQRPEQVIYYKRKITMLKIPQDARRNALNIIFRFSIGEFIRKADDPTHRYLTFDPDTSQLIHAILPKVYHLNIILRTTYMEKDLSSKVELQKFRLIVDKNGIKRVEQLRT